MPFVFRSDQERGMPPILRDVLERRGWVEYDEAEPADAQPPVNLFWRTNRFTASQIHSAKYPVQRINHYPKSSEITKKDHLYRHLRRMRVVHGSCYEFSPVTFGLPNDYVKFCQFFTSEREKWEANEEKLKEQLRAAGRSKEEITRWADSRLPPTYICKPSDMSRGRKIFVFRDISELTYDCSSVVQRYIDKPLLIHGHKVDYRVYVLVTSFQPLRAYIFDEFLARFSTEKYDLSDISNVFGHLTNYSVNKNSSQYEQYKQGIGTGSKWHQDQVREFFASHGLSWDVMWQRVEVLVSYTLLSIASVVPPVAQCFELYGFDIMFDESFKPWLVEVNFSPALAVDSDTDDRVKRALMNDVIDTLKIEEYAGSGAQTPGRSKGEVESEPPSTGVPTAAVASKPKAKPAAGTTSGRAAALTRSSAPKSQQPVAAGSSASSRRHVELVDAPAGKFRWCFPFSPQTEQLAQQMTEGNPNFDAALRGCIAEVKRKEAKILPQMADYGARYRERTGAKAPDPMLAGLEDSGHATAPPALSASSSFSNTTTPREAPARNVREGNSARGSQSNSSASRAPSAGRSAPASAGPHEASTAETTLRVARRPSGVKSAGPKTKPPGGSRALPTGNPSATTTTSAPASNFDDMLHQLLEEAKAIGK
jgi:tubulin polyglutamylase TTLL2